jgi:hypothetical protein
VASSTVDGIMLISFSIIFTVFFLAHAKLVFCANFSQTEYQVLNDLYVSTNGPHWRWINDSGVPWNFTSSENPCADNWQGITCSLPEPFDLYYVTAIKLDEHNLHGTLPASWSQLTALSDLRMSENLLSGTVPPELTCHTGLRNLILSGNLFTGRLSDCFTSLQPTVNIVLYRNRLSGTIPNSISALRNLSDLRLQLNWLSGPIPEILPPLLSFLDLSENVLSGSIPKLAIGDGLTSLLLHNNFLNGPLPAYMPAELCDLNLGSNYLSGTISKEYGSLEKLQVFLLNNNEIYGTIPALLSNFALSVLHLQSNHLSGAVSSVFNSTVQIRLGVVLLSNNYLTGDIPDELSRFSLFELALDVNCFNTVLPSSVCGFRTMQTLILSGLHQNRVCSKKVWKVSQATVSRPNPGTIPQCILELPSLISLAMSGNGYTGTIPNIAEENMNPYLNTLDMSFNKLTGTLPFSLQHRLWSSLDVSNNRITGTLDAGFAAQQSYTSVYLYNNRISGSIPNSVLDVKNVSVLGTNLFQCNNDRSNLPSHDRQVETYKCGSSSFNSPYYVWVTLFVASLITGLLVLQNNLFLGATFEYSKKLVLKWYSYTENITAVELKRKVKHVDQFSAVCRLLCFFVCRVYFDDSLCTSACLLVAKHWFLIIHIRVCLGSISCV